MRAIGIPCGRKTKHQLSHAARRSLRERFLVDERTTLPVVQVALLLGEPPRIAFDKAALEEPAGGARRQHDQTREPELPRALLDLVQQRLAITFAAKIG